MKYLFLLVVIGSAVALAGCSSTPDCLKSEPYEHAEAFPPLKSPPGLDVPAPDPDMQIPTVKNGPIARFSKAPGDVDTSAPAARCLTTPPPLPQGSS